MNHIFCETQSPEICNGILTLATKSPEIQCSAKHAAIHMVPFVRVLFRATKLVFAFPITVDCILSNSRTSHQGHRRSQ